MYLIEKLEIEIPADRLLNETLKRGLVFKYGQGDRIIICEPEALNSEIINPPALYGERQDLDENGVIVVFKTPVYDATYPYTGHSEKLIKFLKFLKRKYSGKLKIKKLKSKSRRT
jgi:hypothetical protein